MKVTGAFFSGGWGPEKPGLGPKKREKIKKIKSGLVHKGAVW
jgi:hypothetical protein